MCKDGKALYLLKVPLLKNTDFGAFVLSKRMKQINLCCFKYIKDVYLKSRTNLIAMS